MCLQNNNHPPLPRETTPVDRYTEFLANANANALPQTLPQLVETFQNLSEDEKCIVRGQSAPAWLQLSNKIVRFTVDIFAPRGGTYSARGREISNNIKNEYIDILSELGFTIRNPPTGRQTTMEEVVLSRIGRGATSSISEDDQLMAANLLNLVIYAHAHAPIPILNRKNLTGQAREQLETDLTGIHDRNEMRNLLQNTIAMCLQSTNRPPLPRETTPVDHHPPLPRETTPVDRYAEFLKESIVSQLDLLRRAVEENIRHTGIVEGLKITIEYFEQAKQIPTGAFNYKPRFPSADFKEMIQNSLKHMKIDDSTKDKNHKPDPKSQASHANDSIDPGKDTKISGRQRKSSALDDSKGGDKTKNNLLSAKRLYESKKRQKRTEKSNVQTSQVEVGGCTEGIAEGLKITIECFEQAKQIPAGAFIPRFPSADFKEIIIYLIDGLKVSVLHHPERIGSFKANLFPLFTAFEQFCEICFQNYALKYMTVCGHCSQTRAAGVASNNNNDFWDGNDSSARGSGDSDDSSSGAGNGSDGSSSGAGRDSTRNSQASGYRGSTRQNAANNDAAVCFAVHLEDGKSRFEIKRDSTLDGFTVVYKQDADEDSFVITTEDSISVLPDMAPSSTNQLEQNDSNCSFGNGSDDFDVIPLQNSLKHIKIDDSTEDKNHKPDPKPQASHANDSIDPGKDTKISGRQRKSSALDDSKGGDKTKNNLLSAKRLYESKKRQKSDPGSIVSCLITNMEESLSEVDYQHFYLYEIWSMSKDDKIMRKILMATTVTSKIANAMKTHPSSNRIQEAACGVIHSLSSDSESRVEIVRVGLVDCVLEAALQVHKRDPYIVETGIAALRLLSKEPVACEKMKEWNAIAPICEGMRTHQKNRKVQTEGCYLLANLAITCEDGNNTVHKAQRYELRAIMTPLEMYKDSQEDVTLAACFALKSYTWRKENLELLAAEYQNILDVVQTMATSNAKYKERLDGVIRRLQRYRGRKNEEQEIELASTVTHVLYILKKKRDSNRIFLFCIRSMVRLATENETAIEPTTERQIAELVITGLKTTFKSCIDIVIECCRLLNLMALRKATFRQVIVEVGGCTVLAEMFERHRKNVEVKINISKILKELSIERACWSEFEAASVGGANAIVDEMMTTSPSDAQIEENALVILNNFMK
eukprot:CAMPEP_0202474568 /NCGR_PEP_ID=MMETSP1360-20130828/92455_1 /ASSEMBLY_ACC=CAM_ASM_000848 /TAXON_ID=515479 /ORGANISM="Licmophora paradoxa, Strain CCMP2313" /LENGTH=1158 /DNA_ID=CAMNT_0049101705 /DNA_START=90 /DNA_END=3565 /DNA_ORIENTATION=-